MKGRPNKRRRVEQEEDILLKKAIVCMDKAIGDDNLQKKKTSFEIFGQYVASELEEISKPDIQKWAKQQITIILNQAQNSGSDGFMYQSYFPQARNAYPYMPTIRQPSSDRSDYSDNSLFDHSTP